jgi:hypothetical protein
MKGKTETLRATEKRYGSVALSIAVGAALVLFLLGLKPLGKGLILGCLFSVFNFALMGETLPMRIGSSRKKGFGIALLMLFLRYALLAVPLAAAIRMDQFHLASTIAGLFLVQLIILLEHLFRFIILKTRNHQAL